MLNLFNGCPIITYFSTYDRGNYWTHFTGSMTNRLYQISMTFFNFLETFPKVVIQPPIQFTTKIFSLNFCFAPPQSAFPWQCNKNQKNGHNSATAHARCKIFLSQDAVYPSSYQLSIHYLSLAVQFFK